LLGLARALEFLIGTEPMDAAAGERLGVFNRVVSDGELPAAALAWAREIAAGPRGAYAAIKENVRDAQTMDPRGFAPREWADGPLGPLAGTS
jgi:2-(1,2-epoxy-1,2-dihydrophenyl)acetyl-CoA isomerase